MPQLKETVSVKAWGGCVSANSRGSKEANVFGGEVKLEIEWESDYVRFYWLLQKLQIYQGKGHWKFEQSSDRTGHSL